MISRIATSAKYPIARLSRNSTRTRAWFHGFDDFDGLALTSNLFIALIATLTIDGIMCLASYTSGHRDTKRASTYVGLARLCNLVITRIATPAKDSNASPSRNTIRTLACRRRHFLDLMMARDLAMARILAKLRLLERHHCLTGFSAVIGKLMVARLLSLGG
jgi:hypothetical protein